MNKLQKARLKLRGNWKPAALRRLVSGWIGYSQGHPVPLGYLAQFKYPFQTKKAGE